MTSLRGVNSKVFWAVGTFGLSVGLKLASNVVLTRLLDPSVFGVMVVVSSIRLGMELLTDVGIEQNIVRSEIGLEDRFFNTAWSLQILRGALLSVLFFAFSPMLSEWYSIDREVFYAISFAPFLNSLHSTSIFAAVKGLEVRTRTLFEVGCETITFILYVIFAWITPTVWALLIGTLLSISLRSALSYLLPHPRHRFLVDRTHALEILKFGRWIAVTSLVVYASTNFDRVYLGSRVLLGVLGVYGLARTVAELPATLAGKLSYQIFFPLLSLRAPTDNTPVFGAIGRIRLQMTMVAAVAMGIGISSADLLVGFVYDARYRDAGWMLSIVLIGAWLSMLANLNESVLLGTNKAKSFTFANVFRFGALAVMLPLLWSTYGLIGAIVALVLSEASRYAAVLFAQGNNRRFIWRQDLAATATMLTMIFLVLAVRRTVGAGTPWDTLVVAEQQAVGKPK